MYTFLEMQLNLCVTQNLLCEQISNLISELQNLFKWAFQRIENSRFKHQMEIYSLILYRFRLDCGLLDIVKKITEFYLVNELNEFKFGVEIGKITEYLFQDYIKVLKSLALSKKKLKIWL